MLEKVEEKKKEKEKPTSSKLMDLISAAMNASLEDLKGHVGNRSSLENFYYVVPKNQH